jgi:uncharacterized protein (DUF2267 family)
LWTQATLETLAERLTAGEADDVAAQLPAEVKQPLVRTPKAAAEPFGRDELIRRIARRAGVDETDAARDARAVMTTLREALTETEFDQMMAQLPDDFWLLVGPVDARASSGLG